VRIHELLYTALQVSECEPFDTHATPN